MYSYYKQGITAREFRNERKSDAELMKVLDDTMKQKHKNRQNIEQALSRMKSQW